MNSEILEYNDHLTGNERDICHELATTIYAHFNESTSRIWHGHPVWFLNENPVAGYSKVKAGIKLIFWSGQSFAEPGLTASGKFKAAEIVYTSIDQINKGDLMRWLDKSKSIQWDYKNIVKRKGVLERLK
ncbi:MAG TPA: hypothetical protein DCX89_00775 [Saprospirales bacterium]|nr:hypothetical protein [Saprospirales bacterium]HAY70398.1 hypothetical protein [Saprospirales bacterium]HRQ29183.1 DUF1801 domain-containing protein [Saprospiraceae bacterium]